MINQKEVIDKKKKEIRTSGSSARLLGIQYRADSPEIKFY